MNIIYPPLVQQMHEMLKKQGIDKPIDQLYKEMVSLDMITQTGEPTNLSIEEGLVKNYQQKHNRLIDFKKEYPIFMSYPKEEFTQQVGVWYVSQKILGDVAVKMDNGQFEYDEMQQVSVYMSYRNYDNPHNSIAETKGCYHPWYTKYDDSEFQFVNGKVAIPLSVIKDMLYRAELGELDLDVEKLEQMAESMEETE